MKSLMFLWREVLEEFGDLCNVSTTKDYETALRRYEHEGWSFMTITLPSFCKDFERSLEDGCIDPNAFAGFKRSASARGLPAFLSGFLDLVFDRRTGVLIDGGAVAGCHRATLARIEAIRAVRQLTLMFGKMLLPCAPRREAAAIRGYIDCEQEVATWERPSDVSSSKLFEYTSSKLFSSIFTILDQQVYNGELVPKHGPGATADGLRGNAKYDQCEWTDRLEQYFPYGDYCLPSWRVPHEAVSSVNFLEPGAERPVKVTLVPKTLKTPRIIAIEPTCMQYIQQAIAESLVRLLEADPLIGGDASYGLCDSSNREVITQTQDRVWPVIGFTSSVPNQELALEGSLSGDLATLDLSEASDRVSNLHVKQLINSDRWPHLSGAVQASRSLKADVPGHGEITLSKFASMGSALCFPIEAMVFTTLVFVGIQKELNTRFTAREFRRMSRFVRVYGDDIIVPTRFVRSVISVLEDYGFRVNHGKSFWNGSFRESCGKEYFEGFDVTITRVRRVFPKSRKDVQEVASVVSLRNQFYELGLWRSAAWCDSMIERLLGHFPSVHPTSQALGRHTYLPYQVDKMSDRTHAPLVKAWVMSSKPPTSIASGNGALLKWFLKRGDEPFADRDHLQRFGRPTRHALKRRLVSPF